MSYNPRPGLAFGTWRAYDPVSLPAAAVAPDTGTLAWVPDVALPPVLRGLSPRYATLTGSDTDAPVVMTATTGNESAPAWSPAGASADARIANSASPRLALMLFETIGVYNASADTLTDAQSVAQNFQTD